MASLKTYLELCRISNLPTVWTNVLAAVILSNNDFFWPNFLTLALSLSLFYSGGMCFNDICDVQIDLKKRPSRPIPSGRITIRNAYLFTAVLFSAGLLLLLLMPNRNALVAGLVLLLLIIIYDEFHKKHVLSVFVMAACRLMIFAVSGIAVAGRMNDAVLMIGVIQFGYVLLISLVARYENHHRDRFKIPVVPAMLAGISLVDGMYLAFLKSPFWLVCGILGVTLTYFGQRYVRGD